MIELAIRALSTIGLRPCLLRAFHTSPRRQALFLGPIIRGALAVAVRLTRRWWVKLSPERRQAFKATLYRRRYYFYVGAGGVVCCGGLFYWSHLETTPITGRQRFVLFSKAAINDLIELFEKEELLLAVSDGSPYLLNTHPHTQRVAAIAERIVHSNQSPDLEGFNWTVFVVDNPEVVNALTLPNGYVFVFSGLVEACQNDDQLALILGHEIAHAVLGHGAESLTRAGLLELLSLFVVALVWALIPIDLMAFFAHSFSKGTINMLLHYPHSRMCETEADTVGLMFAAKACYNPTQGVDVWKCAPFEEAATHYLSTHPLHEARFDYLTSLLPSAHQLWDESECKETREEVLVFQSVVSKALKKVFNI